MFVRMNQKHRQRTYLAARDRVNAVLGKGQFVWVGALRCWLTTSRVSPVILASYTGMIIFVPVSFFWLSSEKWPCDNSLLPSWDMWITDIEGIAHFIFFTTISNMAPFPRRASRRYFCALVDSKIRHSPNPFTFSKCREALIGRIMDSADAVVIPRSSSWHSNTSDTRGRLRTSR